MKDWYTLASIISYKLKVFHNHREDIIQYIVIALWEASENGDFEANKATIAYRAGVDYMRTTFGRENPKTARLEVALEDFDLDREATFINENIITIKQLYAKLKLEEQLVIAGLLEGMTLNEIGKGLGVTESRACQIYNEALKYMRDQV